MHDLARHKQKRCGLLKYSCDFLIKSHLKIRLYVCGWIYVNETMESIPGWRHNAADEIKNHFKWCALRWNQVMREECSPFALPVFLFFRTLFIILCIVLLCSAASIGSCCSIPKCFCESRPMPIQRYWNAKNSITCVLFWVGNCTKKLKQIEIFTTIKKKQISPSDSELPTRIHSCAPNHIRLNFLIRLHTIIPNCLVIILGIFPAPECLSRI